MKVIARASAVLLSALLLPGTATAIEDVRDLGPMMQTLNDTLEFGRSGASMEYTNPATGNRGTIKALSPTGQRDGRVCWAFERTYGKPGQLQTLGGVACRTADGLWQIVEEGPVQASSAVARAEPAPTSSALPKPSYDRTFVLEIQQRLNALGYDPGPSDGLYGPRTGNAITAFQGDQGMAVDGKPSVDVLTRLRETSPSTAADLPWKQPASEPEPAPAPAVTQAAAPTAGGMLSVADLAKDPAAYAGRSVSVAGTYLHYNESWAKLLASDDSTSEFVYMHLGNLSEPDRSTLRSECFLCEVEATGRVEVRELMFGTSSMGDVYAIVVNRLERLE